MKKHIKYIRVYEFRKLDGMDASKRMWFPASVTLDCLLAMSMVFPGYIMSSQAKGSQDHYMTIVKIFLFYRRMKLLIKIRLL